MNPWIWAAAYAVLGVEALLLAAFLAPRTIPLARRWGFVAGTGGRHIHRTPTTTLGGQAIVWSFVLVLLGNAALAWAFRGALLDRLPEIGRFVPNFPSVAGRLAVLLGGAMAMSLLGLADDRRPLGPRIKLAAMVLAALPLLAVDIRIQGFLPGPWAGGAATVLWVVCITNAFNLLDNMDGLAAGVAAIAAGAFGLVSLFAGEWFVAGLYAVLAGSLLGFLVHNFHPARLFMGDNGSLFVGYLVAGLSIQSTYYQRGVPTALPVLVPFIVLGVPLFDTASVLWIRWRAGAPLMVGDRNHFSHRLVDLGMSQRRAVSFIYIVTGAAALGALPLRTVALPGALAILVQTVLLFWIIYRLERTARRRPESGGGAPQG